MKKPIISMIAAIGGAKRVLGKDNKLIWDIPEDMQYFRDKTKGHAMIMGSKTYKSIGKPLPNRTNIVVTRNKDFKVDGVITTHSIEEAIEEAKKVEKKEIMVIGGGQIYELAMKYADRLYLTLIKGDFDGEAFFPDYSEFKRVVKKRASHDDNYDYTFLDLEKNYE